MKKLTAIALAAVMLASPITANAAQPSESARLNAEYLTKKGTDGTPNWFNGSYYSDQYKDLKIGMLISDITLCMVSRKEGTISLILMRKDA